jgi:putative flippase GtrA
MTQRLGGQIGQVGRFGLVGLFVAALDYAVFAGLLLAFPGQHLAANLAGKLAGAAIGFVLHRNFTFAGQRRDALGRQAFSYALLLGFNLGLGSGLLWLLVDGLHLNPWWSRLFVDGVVIASSFLGSKLWVYRAA